MMKCIYTLMEKKIIFADNDTYHASLKISAPGRVLDSLQQTLN